LTHKGILKGVRGSCGGYQLARTPRKITVEDILLAGSVQKEHGASISECALVKKVVAPVLAEAKAACCEVLARITVYELISWARPNEQAN
jgi:DNA-binding IscR family transcriptional regulator